MKARLFTLGLGLMSTVVLGCSPCDLARAADPCYDCVRECRKEYINRAIENGYPLNTNEALGTCRDYCQANQLCN